MFTGWRMLKRWLFWGVFFISVANLFYDFGNAVYPLFDSRGSILKGSHRGIHIGDSRAKVAHMLNSIDSNGYLKLMAFKSAGGAKPQYLFVSGDAMDARVWSIAYPGFYKEMIQVSFNDDGIVEKIEYSRFPFAP